MEDNSITKEYQDIFAADALKELLPNQADHHRREFGNSLSLNKASRSCCFNTCPKCGVSVG